MVKPRFTIDVQTFANLLLLVVPGGAVYFWTRGDQLDEEAMAAGGPVVTAHNDEYALLSRERIQVVNLGRGTTGAESSTSFGTWVIRNGAYPASCMAARGNSFEFMRPGH